MCSRGEPKLYNRSASPALVVRAAASGYRPIGRALSGARVKTNIQVEKQLRAERKVRLDVYTRLDPIWYEDPGRRDIGTEFLSVARRLLPEAAFQRSGLWVFVSPENAPLVQQGWKLHLSARDQDAITVLERAAEICRRRSVRFKFTADRFLLRLVNSKMWPREASGKFVVIYPQCTSDFLEIGRELDEMLSECRGPFVLSDRRFGQSQSVYYRYGGFRSLTQVQSNGTRIHLLSFPSGDVVKDVRAPAFMPPLGVANPLADKSDLSSGPGGETAIATGPVCIARRFVVESSLHTTYASFSAAGGVYRARDVVSGDTVALKEARPYVGHSISPHGYAIAALEHEFRILTALGDTGITPRPIGLFWDSGGRHRFLAEEFIPGMLLGPLLIANNPVLDTQRTDEHKREYRHLLRRVWLQLALAIDSIHKRGICIGDLSLTNIVVDNWEGSPELRIIDLEGAWFVGEPPADVYTPGFALGPEQSNGTGKSQRELLQIRGTSDDLFSLGRVCLAGLIPAVSLAALSTKAANRVFRAAAAQIKIPEAVFELLISLTEADVSRRPTAAEVAAFFSTDSSVEGEPAAMPQIPYQDNVDGLMGKLADHILESGDVSRQDRVFPADPRVFSTNGVNLAHGIAGVLHALIAADRPIDEKYRTWLLSQALDSDKLSPGLFAGVSGIAAVLSEMGEDELAITAIRRASNHRIAKQDPFIYGGGAGIGLAMLWLFGRTRRPELLEDASRVADGLLLQVSSGDIVGIWHDDAGDLPTGLVNGGAGVSLFLLYMWLATGIEKYRQVGQVALQTVLESHVVPEGKGYWTFPSFANKGEKYVRNYWADGTAGIAAVLVRWIRATGDDGYHYFLNNMLPDTERNMTIFPSLFLGMSGMGMFHLDLFKLLGKHSSLATCESLVRAIALFTIERPTGVGLPGEQLQRLSNDLATGSAGVLLFIAHFAKARGGTLGSSFGIAPLPDDLLPPFSENHSQNVLCRDAALSNT